MADHSSGSDNDEDDFGHDVSPVTSAPVVIMKRFSDVIDQISTLYHNALSSTYQMDRFKANCWNLVCAKVGISVSEGDQAKEEDLWLLCRKRYYETKDNLPLQSNVHFIFNAFSEEGGWPEEVLDDLNTRESKMKIRPSWVGLKLDVVKKASDAVKMHYYFGSKIWEQWKECKKYIHNHLNPYWIDPSLLKHCIQFSNKRKLLKRFRK